MRRRERSTDHWKIQKKKKSRKEDKSKRKTKFWWKNATLSQLWAIVVFDCCSGTTPIHHIDDTRPSLPRLLVVAVSVTLVTSPSISNASVADSNQDDLHHVTCAATAPSINHSVTLATISQWFLFFYLFNFSISHSTSMLSSHFESTSTSNDERPSTSCVPVESESGTFTWFF